MKIAGIIAEYNPFHKGHAYHIAKTREITGADYIIVVLSGNFTQRGIPACFDKYTRAQCALSCGADLVLELPFAYATGSAEYFAEGAVSILNRLGCVDFLSFGTEAELSPDLFTKTAAFFCDEPEEYQKRLKVLLKQGLSFPAARQQAAEGFLSAKALSLLTSPNATLGLEYCKALHRLHSAILPVPILREGAGYHEESIRENDFSSATALRFLLQETYTAKNSVCGSPLPENSSDALSAFFNQIPDSCAACLPRQKLLPVFMEDFFPYFSYLAQTRPQELTDIWDISPELAARIGTRTAPCSYEDWLAGIKSKQYTRTRIERCLLHLLLRLTREDIFRFRPSAGNIAGYARILGFQKAAAPLLKQLKETASLPLLTKLAQKEQRCDDTQLRLLSYDILAADLYNRVVYLKYGVLLPDEYSYILIDDMPER